MDKDIKKEEDEQQQQQQQPILLGGQDEDEVDLFGGHDDTATAATTTSPSSSKELLDKIISPSPYAHHVTGPASFRFRNALQRVTTNPTTDIEAWQAILTETNTCWRALMPPVLHTTPDASIKLDWMESVHGTLLKYFPFASAHYVTIAEILLVTSARVGEEGGPVMDYGIVNPRLAVAEQKLEHLLETALGITMDGTPTSEMGGMCTSSVDLWLIYIKKRIRDAVRYASSTLPPSTPEAQSELIQEWTLKAFEVAIQHAAWVYNNHTLWKQYLAYVKTLPNNMVLLRQVYQKLVTHPMTGLDQLWQEYEAFERTQNEALATALVAEFAPKYQHARSVYLERNRVYNVSDLQLHRLAIPPIEPNHEDDDNDDYHAKAWEEYSFLQLWTKRLSYERTNPERLGASDYIVRTRQAYKEMICVLTGHAEAWHMWSMWEYHHTQKVEMACNILALGQDHVESTLLAHAHAQLVELQHPTSSSNHNDNNNNNNTAEKSLQVMEQFLKRSPNTLGFVLYQKMVRRYKGMDAARAVFAKARRILTDPSKMEYDSHKKKKTHKEETSPDDTTEQQQQQKEQDQAHHHSEFDRKMITNRLDESIGIRTTTNNKTTANNGEKLKNQDTTTQDDNEANDDSTATTTKAGPITWHLYASHASMEHDVNKSPEIAARVYELGLRKHASFLTKPPYVKRYAQLLMELGDTENLRALLTRAVAAASTQQGKTHVLGELWDMTLEFESILSATSPQHASLMVACEKQRRAALMGPQVEDVATGGTTLADGGTGASVGIGAHKSTIAEQLVRSEGYDVSSMIVNGLSRSVDVLEIMGLWEGSSSSASQHKVVSNHHNDDDDNDDGAGTRADICFQQRLKFKRLSEAGLATEQEMGGAGGIGGGGAASKALSARERLQQSAMPTGALAFKSPEWLRGLVLLLPVSRYRANKPHMIEMALNSLKNSTLPQERPLDNGKKRSRGDGGDGNDDSSDDDDQDLGGSGGYGTQFRARQRARMAQPINGTANDGLSLTT